MELIPELLSYLRMMIDVLNRKKDILNEILEVSHVQEALISSSDIDEKAFQTTLDRKSGLIDKINEMDDGFQALYNKIEYKIKDGGKEYADVIREMQALISDVTALSVDITALEKKNKDSLDKKVMEIRKGKKQFTVNRQTANRYYRNMTGTGINDSAFIDQKN